MISQLVRFAVKASVFLLLMVAVMVSSTEKVEAQVPAPFLGTPYYGSFAINQGYTNDHRAYDFRLRYDPVLAAGSGTIADLRWFNDDRRCLNQAPFDFCGFGLHARVQHLAANNYTTIYAHLSATAFNLNPMM